MPVIVILIATFVGVAALVCGALLLFSGESKEAVESRLDLLTGNAAPQRGGVNSISVLASPLDEANTLADRFLARFVSLRKLLEQSGLHLTPIRFAFITLVTGVLGVGAGLAFFPWVVAPATGLAGATLPLLMVMFKRKRRLAAFGRQLPEALELISRALRAGHSLGAGINLAATEMPDPIATEFGRCYEEQNLGIPLEQALDEMTVRVPNLDLRFFATAIILQRQTGGDLAEILDKIGHLIRERFKIWGQIQALTGEGRLSGIVLLALPPVLFLVMYKMNPEKMNPEYCMVLFNDPLGQRMLAVAVIMQLIGAYVIRKIIRIKV
jgi:tight adherence protein B